MNTILALLAGTVLAGALFAATLWSAAQAWRQAGRLRVTHVALLLLTLAGMASLEAVWPGAAALSGAGLVMAGLAGVLFESGWARLLPAAQGAFGTALLLGLPFGAAA